MLLQVVIRHDARSTVVGEFSTLEEASKVFVDLCKDRFYRQQNNCSGVEIVSIQEDGSSHQLEWFSFS